MFNEIKEKKKTCDIFLKIMCFDINIEDLKNRIKSLEKNFNLQKQKYFEEIRKIDEIIHHLNCNLLKNYL